MEGLIERVSVITKSPVNTIVSQNNYRQCALLFLVIMCFITIVPTKASAERLSRFEMISMLYEKVYSHVISEIEATESGLLEQYDDGAYHLDLPATRGMAAIALYRMWQYQGAHAIAPRAFSDIDDFSSYKVALGKVGGGFMPDRRGRFLPENMVNRRDIFHAVTILVDRNVISKSKILPLKDRKIADSLDQKLWEAQVKAVKEKDIPAIEPSMEFVRATDSSVVSSKQTLSRVRKADRLVGTQQLNPQSISNLGEASRNLDEVEEILQSLGGNIMEISNTYPQNPYDDREIRKALVQMNEVLNALIERFEYSLFQLRKSLPVSPKQVKLTTDLNLRLRENISKATSLRKVIADRLSAEAVTEYQ